MSSVAYSPNSPQIKIEIPNNSYLSDVAMPIEDLWTQVLLISPTASGKTTFLLTFSKVILAVPTQDLARQLEKKGVPAIMQDVAAADLAASERYVSTYDSLPRLVEELSLARGEDLSEWMLVIDEAHHILSDASPAFRLQAISNMLNVTINFGRVIAMTGTPPDIPIPTFDQAQLIQFTKHRDPISLYLIKGDSTSKMVDVIINKFRYNKVIVHMNDKNKGCQTAKELEMLGISSFLFNADTKKEEYHTQMLEIGQLPKDCQSLITTTLYNDGYSFIEKKKYAVLISPESRLTPEDIEQIANRIRGNAPDGVFWLKRKHDLRIHIFDMKKAIKELRESCLVDQQDAQNIINILATIYKRSGKKKDELIKASTHILRNHLKHLKLVEHEDGCLSVEIDEIWLANTVYEQWRTACNHSSGLMIHTLQKRYGYKFIKVLNIDAKATEEEKERRAEAKRITKEERKEVYNNTIETLREQNNDETDEIVARTNIKNTLGEANQEEKEIAITTLRLNDIGMSVRSALDIIESFKPETPNALTTITKTVRMARLRHLISQDIEGERHHIRVNPIVNFFTIIMGSYPVGSVVEENNLQEVFHIASTKCPLLGKKYDSHRKRMALIKQCYRVERGHVKTAKGWRKKPIVKALYPFDPKIKIKWSSYVDGEEDSLIEDFL